MLPSHEACMCYNLPIQIDSVLKLARIVIWYRSDILTNFRVGDRLSMEGGSCVKVALSGMVVGSIDIEWKQLLEY